MDTLKRMNIVAANSDFIGLRANKTQLNQVFKNSLLNLLFLQKNLSSLRSGDAAFSSFSRIKALQSMAKLAASVLG